MNGYQSVVTKNDPEIHYQQIMNIYQRLLDSSHQQVENME